MTPIASGMATGRNYGIAQSTRILLEGRPGSGKTTLARRLVAGLRERDIPVTGFTTEEIREAGKRVGFAIETADGERDVLAHVDLPGPPRVGKYGVDLAALERLANPALRADAGELVVIDELGKMELASSPFRDAVKQLFDSPADVVATVHVFRHPFTDALKGRPDVERLQVTAANRDDLARVLVRKLMA
jgi:nucleoside-triphosphatase